MKTLLYDSSMLVHLASFIYVLGFMVIDQLRLRLMILVGTALYIAYYLILDPPLWDAMFWGVVMSIVNIWVITKLILDRSTYNLSEDNLRLYMVFDQMTPGEFRRLLKLAEWRSGIEQVVLTTQDQPVQSLYYVLEGPVVVSKQGENFSIPGEIFIGEVAFFLETDASATVSVAPQARFVKWEIDTLIELQKKEPGIQAALHGILNKDMASKIASSVGTTTDAPQFFG